MLNYSLRGRPTPPGAKAAKSLHPLNVIPQKFPLSLPAFRIIGSGSPLRAHQRVTSGKPYQDVHVIPQILS